jgi:hypothetical protein
MAASPIMTKPRWSPCSGVTWPSESLGYSKTKTLTSWAMAIGQTALSEYVRSLGIMQHAESVKTEGEEEPHVKTIIEHSIYDRITHDGETDRVTVQRGQLAERISWLLKPENDRLRGHGYYPNYFIRPCEVLDIILGPRSSTQFRR